MSNDANPLRNAFPKSRLSDVSLADGRSGQWLQIEPLSLRLLEKSLRKEENGFARMVKGLYVGLVELLNMNRGNSLLLTRDNVERISRVEERHQKKCRDFLVDIGLLDIRSERNQSTGGISLRYTILPCPWQGYGRETTKPNGPAPKPADQGDDPSACPENPSQGALGEAGGRPVLPTTVEPKEEPTVSMSTRTRGVDIETDLASLSKTVRRPPFRLGLLSRSELVNLWRTFGGWLPRPATPLQPLIALLDSTRGFRWIPEVKGGDWGRVFGFLGKLYSEGAPCLHRDLMDTVIEWDMIPMPKGGGPNLRYLFVTLREEAIRRHGRRYEEEGAARKEAEKSPWWMEDPEMQALAQEFAERGRTVCRER